MSPELRAELVHRIQELTHPLEPIPINHATKLKELSDIKCVAFDFYGTMFISGVGDIGIDEEQEKESETIFRDSLTECGLQVEHPAVGSEGLEILKESLDRHIKKAMDRGLSYPEPEIREVWLDTLEKLQQKSMISGGIDSRVATRFAVEFEFRINAIWPVPDLAKHLNGLKKMSLKLGIISNSQFYTPLAFEAIIGQKPEKFGFEKDLLVWSFESGRKKPDIDFYRIFTNRIEQKNMTPEEVLYVGNDIQKDMIPAKKLGMKTALFVGDERSIRHEESDLSDLSLAPDLVIDNLGQIQSCLELQP